MEAVISPQSENLLVFKEEGRLNNPKILSEAFNLAPLLAPRVSLGSQGSFATIFRKT